MARALTVADYGILATLFSLMYLFGIFSESLQLVVARYSAADNNSSTIKSLFVKVFKNSARLSCIIFVAYLIASIPLSSFLKIDYWLLAINGIFIFNAFFIPISRGILQGTQRFFSLGINMITESTIKLVLASLLVLAGWKVYGALVGTIFAVSAAFVFSLIPIRKILAVKAQHSTKIDNVRGYAKPIFFVLLILMVFYSIDIIIAKAIFNEEVAGAYAISSVIAKMIFLGTYPISKALFPLGVRDQFLRENSKRAFLNAIVILSMAIFVALIIFFFFPSELINIFAGKDIPLATDILFLMGVSTSILSFANLITFYKLSRGKTRGYWIMGAVLAIEVAGLFYFSSDLVSFSIAFCIASISLLIASVFALR